MFDTHTHLNFPGFQENLPRVLQESRDAGVDKFIVPGVDLDTSALAVAIAEEHENVYAAVGVHPEDCQGSEGESALSVNQLEVELKKLATSPKVVAIGEIGLDKHTVERSFGAFDHAVFDQQKKMFRAQFVLAQELGLSVIIHCRLAKDELLQELRELWSNFYSNRVVIHCCEPEKDLLDFAIQHDVFIGVDGDVTYNSVKKEFIKTVPLERLLLETDSPFLTPEPVRSDKARKFPNTPANLPLIAQAVADATGKNLADVVSQTTRSAQILFQLEENYSV